MFLVLIEIVTQIAFSQDCKYLYTVSGDSCIFVWRLSREITQVSWVLYIPKLHVSTLHVLAVYLTSGACVQNVCSEDVLKQ